MVDLTLKINDLDRNFSGKSGAWEPHSALIDFCEPNYVWTPFIAEFWNTCTALGMFLQGCIALASLSPVASDAAEHGLLPHSKSRTPLSMLLCAYPRFVVTWGAFLVQSLGSSALHSTLRREYQAVDEIGMLICALSCLYCLHARPLLRIVHEERTATHQNDENFNVRLALGLCCVGAIMCIVYFLWEMFTVFHALFTPIEFYALGRAIWLRRSFRRAEAESEGEPNKLSRLRIRFCQLIEYGSCMYVFAIVCWCLEMVRCDDVRSVHTHAWAWHLMVGAGFNLMAAALVLLALIKQMQFQKTSQGKTD
eukprot:TRINITY_DN37590_c0_g1_i1.p1 TRINITY_DN37590_c0_g1~~TRINITY_DN37590_c0_g1_i1.p1  ORF type:complete len:309 (+),score=14.37 TRINITY_DN37590_c0_g1_i1:65-991(+)